MGTPRTRRRKKIEAPFPGLRPFLSGENLIFFGREGQSNELINRLRENHFLAVLGSSGSGKSSLVRAGLQPDLEAGLMSGVRPNWRVAILRPGDRPIHALAEALAEFIDSSSDEGFQLLSPTDMILTMLQASSFGLKEAALGPILTPEDNLVVIVDQFEEIFRFNEERPDLQRLDEAQAFIRLLLEASNDPTLPIYVVITMRSDFLGECPRFAGLAESINKGQYLVPRLSRAQMREAITGPVAVFNGSIAPDLVIRILNDIGDNADQLPILQHALMRTWDQHCEGEELVMSDYEAIGGLGNALNQHAEEIYEELDRKGLGGLVQQLFKCLTQLEGDGKGIRRPTRMREVMEVTGATTEQLTTIVDAFRCQGRTFLMPPQEVPLTPETILDISHESFMRLWRRLVGWVREETQSAEEYLRLSRAATEYAQGKVNLWRQPELGIALKWQEANAPSAAWAARYDGNFDKALAFLAESQKAWQQEEEDKAAMVLLQRKSEERKKTVRRQTILLILMGGMLTIVTSALLFAWYQNGVANAERKQAELQTKKADSTAQELAVVNQALNDSSARIHELNANLKLALDTLKDYAATIVKQEAELRTQYGVILQKNSDLERGKSALANYNEQLRRSNENLKLKEHKADSLAKAAITEKTAAERKSMILQALQYAEQSLAAPEDEVARLLALRAYNDIVSLEADAMDPRIYQALNEALERVDPMVSKSFYFTPAAVAFDEGCVQPRILAIDGSWFELISDLQGYHPNPKPSAGTCAIRFLTYRRDQKHIFASDLSNRLKVYRAQTATADLTLPGHTAAITAATDLPNPNEFLSCDVSGKVLKWTTNGATSVSQVVLNDPDTKFTAMLLDASGQYLALGGEGTLRVYDAGSLRKPRAVEVDGTVTALAFSPVGNVLFYGLNNGGMGYVPLSGEMTKREYPIHESRVSDIRFSPDGHWLVSCSYDRTLRIFNTERPLQNPIVLKGHKDWVLGLGFSSDSKKIYSISKDKTMRYWFTTTSQLADELNSRTVRKEFDHWEVEQYNIQNTNSVKGVRK